ncbi:hypothetical protein Bca4012_091006 [Brassica carinata]
MFPALLCPIASFSSVSMSSLPLLARVVSSSSFFLSLKVTISQAGRSTVVGSIVGDSFFWKHRSGVRLEQP